jgi:hypothetical protein
MGGWVSGWGGIPDTRGDAFWIVDEGDDKLSEDEVEDGVVGEEGGNIRGDFNAEVFDGAGTFLDLPGGIQVIRIDNILDEWIPEERANGNPRDLDSCEESKIGGEEGGKWVDGDHELHLVADTGKDSNEIEDLHTLALPNEEE